MSLSRRKRVLETPCDHCLIILGSLLDHCRIVVGSSSDRRRIVVGSSSDRCRIVVGSRLTSQLYDGRSVERIVVGSLSVSFAVLADRHRSPLLVDCRYSAFFCDCADRYAASIVAPYRLFRSYRSLHPSEGSYVARGVRVHTSFVDRADRIDRPIGSLVVLSSPISSFTNVSLIGVLLVVLSC